jgi:TonB-dependent starch-binding outer membrane protein SusC
MRSKFKWIFTLLIAFTMQFSFAQEKTVTGSVSDEKGTLPGANVVVKGTTRGVQTDMDGKYAIKVKQGETLVYSFIGMKDQSIVVGASNSINVKLVNSSKILDEVVVLGYDKTATKPKSIAASTTVSSESLKNRPNITVLQSLQGNAAGLNVFTSSGSPGTAKFDLLIRGNGSINSSTEPLYVIDGVPTNSVVFRNINPEDIETISVLKDAVATSIYGNRGANGVVVIKTKSGKYDSKMVVSYSSTYGISELPGDDYNIMNSQQLLRLQRDRSAPTPSGLNPYFNQYFGFDGSPLTDAQINSIPTTDWRDVFFRRSTTQTHNVSLTSGSKNLTNFSSVSYTDQKGIVNNTDFKRFTLRSNINGKSDNERFKFGFNTTLAYSRRNQLGQETNDGINNNVVQNPLQGALTGVPYYPADLYPGTGQGLFDLIATDFDNGNTTIVLQDLLQEGNQPNRYSDLKILTNANLSYDLTKNITYNTKVGVDYTVSDRIFARAPWSYLAIAVRETNSVPYGGFESRTNDKDFGFNAVNSLRYSKKFANKHTFDLGLYTEYVKAVRTLGFNQQNGLDLLNYSFGAGTGWTNVGANNPTLRPTNSAFKQKAGTFSYFATLGYDFDDKYGIDALVRRDASYRFIDEFKWGTFWSVGGRWNIDKENFMKDSAFNLLKLRVSHGIQGNQNLGVPAFGGNPLYTASDDVRDLVGTGSGYGNTGAYVLSQFGNNTLQWEEQTMSNLGLDFEIWKSRFTGTIDVYNRTTNNLFNDKNLSAIAGVGTTQLGNFGKLRNRGIEVALKYKIIRKNDVNLEIFANGSYNKNEILQVVRTPGGDTILEEGGQVNEYYVVPYVGVNPDNGELLFLDINGNNTENPTDADRRRTGYSNTPIYQGGFGFSFDFKGFFLDSQFSYAYDVKRFDYAMLWLNSPSFIPDNNVSADLLNSWTSTNTNTDIPSLDAVNFDLGSEFSDMWLKNASYVRLKNISFGYDFNKKLLKGTFISSLKVFTQAENLYTWTSWRGFDPDTGELTSLGRFPSPKTISFGLNVQF